VYGSLTKDLIWCNIRLSYQQSEVYYMKKDHKKAGDSRNALANAARNQMLFDAIAAEGDDIEGVRKAVEKGANLNSRVKKHFPLEEAIILGKTERFKLLSGIVPKVGEKANINATIITGKDNVEMPLIFFAASLGRSNIVRHMLENGVDPEVLNKSINGYKLIHYAAYSDDCATFDVLNTEVQALRVVTDRSGYYCLHTVARKGKITMLRHLLKLGADPKCRDAQRRTPIHHAALKGQKEAVAILLTPATRSHQDINGRNVFLLCVERGDVELLKSMDFTDQEYSFCDNNNVSAMHIAAQKNNVEMLQFLQCKGGLGNLITDRKKRMPIHFSAESNSLEAFNFLIDTLAVELESSVKNKFKGSDLKRAVGIKLIETLLSWKDENGNTVVESAIQGNADKILERLVQLGVKFSGKNSRGNTLIHEAVEVGNAAIIPLLHKLGADSTKLNTAGLRAEDLAAEKGHIEVLVALKALPNSNFKLKDQNGIQPIHRAASAGKQEAVEWLLCNGGGTLLDEDNLGRNCLFHAVRGDQHEQVRHLVTVKGMDLRALCAKKLTVMHHAVFKEAKKSIAVLRELGLSLDEQGCDGILPLHVVVRANLVAMVDYLIEIGADKQGVNEVGQNSWFYAAKLQTDEMRECLRGHEIVLCADSRGVTPMHYSAVESNLEGLKFFRKTNLSCFDRDMNGETPLDKVRKKIKKAQSEIEAIKEKPFAKMHNSKEELSEFNLLQSTVKNLKIVESYLLKQEAVVSKSNFGSPSNFAFGRNESKQLRANLKREHDTEEPHESSGTKKQLLEPSPQYKIISENPDAKDPSTDIEEAEYSEASSKNLL
jgi:ankyrin repeat protein